MALDLAKDPEDRQQLITELVLLNIRAKTGFRCLDLLPEIETFPPTMLREFLVVMLQVYIVNEPFPHRRIQDVLNASDPTPDERTLQAFLVFMMIMMMMRSNDRSQVLELIELAKRLYAKSKEHPDELDDDRVVVMVSPTEYIHLMDCYTLAHRHLNRDIEATQDALP